MRVKFIWNRTIIAKLINIEHRTDTAHAMNQCCIKVWSQDEYWTLTWVAV